MMAKLHIRKNIMQLSDGIHQPGEPVGHGGPRGFKSRPRRFVILIYS